MSNKKQTAQIELYTKAKAMSNCLKHNIKVYPVYKNRKWYVEVNNQGTVNTYKKVIGEGNTLSSKNPEHDGVNWCEAIKKTWQHWSELINKNK